MTYTLTLVQLDATLASTPPDQQLTYFAGDLQHALNVPPPVVIAYSVTVDVRAGEVLRLRAAPSVSALILANLHPGDLLGVIDPPTPVEADTLSWIKVRAGGLTGWVAQLYTTRVVPAVNHLGLHILEDGLAQIQAFLATGAQMASATVVDNAGLANLLAQTVPYVLFRRWPDNAGLAIPDDPTAAETYGHERVRARFAADNQLGAAALNVYICEDNEAKWSPGHGGFWLGTLRELTAMGRRGAMGCYGVGQPEPTEWATMTPALQFAAANGHIVALDNYCAKDTPLDQLSADTADYELRFVRLYNAVPPDARPKLVIKEAAHEFTRGKFEGTAHLIKFAQLYGAALAIYDYVAGFNLWTVAKAGGWDDACIDAALTDQGFIDLFPKKK